MRRLRRTERNDDDGLSTNSVKTPSSRAKTHLRTPCLPPLPPLPSRHPEVPYAYAASLGVVADAARPSTKTSLKYTYTDDERDDPFVPCMGSYLQASVEGAGERCGLAGEGRVHARVRGGGRGLLLPMLLSLCRRFAIVEGAWFAMGLYFVVGNLLSSGASLQPHTCADTAGVCVRARACVCCVCVYVCVLVDEEILESNNACEDSVQSARQHTGRG